MYNRAMVTKEQLEARLTAAIKAGDAVEKRTLRMVLTEWKLAEVEQGGELDDEQALAVLQKEARSRREAIADAERAGRPEIVESTQAELDYLGKYLPKPLSQAELKELALQSIEDTGASDPAQMGLVMKDLMPKLEGRADGKDASNAVRSLLGAN